MKFLGYFAEIRPESYIFCSTATFAEMEDDHGMRIYEAVDKPYLGDHTVITHRHGRPMYLGPKVYEPSDYAKPSERS